MAEKLKPCPFCGSEAELFKVEKMGAATPDDELEAYYIVCQKCPVQINLTGELSDAIAAWNRREGVKAQSRPLAYAPEMYELLKVWTQVGAEPMLMNARDTARKLLARIDGEEAEHEQHN